MKLLLDTHSFLRFIAGDRQLSEKAQNLIEDSNNDVFISIAGLWEIAIKASIGKLTLVKPFDELIPEQLQINAIEVVNVTLDDLSTVAKLPFHHRDPFDRLMIAQAITRCIPVVSIDSELPQYNIDIIW